MITFPQPTLGPFRDLVSVVTLSFVMGTTVQATLICRSISLFMKPCVHSPLPRPRVETSSTPEESLEEWRCPRVNNC